LTPAHTHGQRRELSLSDLKKLEIGFEIEVRGVGTPPDFTGKNTR